MDDEALRRMDDELGTTNYRTHEFGDSIFVERIEHSAARFEQRCPAA
jgi:hypothetical protein